MSKQTKHPTLLGKDGKKYDFQKNQVDGLPPLEIGDTFFYRGKGSGSAQVYRVRLKAIVGRVCLLEILSCDGSEGQAELWVDLRKVDVVQMILDTGNPMPPGFGGPLPPDDAPPPIEEDDEPKWEDETPEKPVSP